MFILTAANEVMDPNLSVPKYQGDFMFVLGIYDERDHSNIMNPLTKENHLLLYKDGMALDDGYEDDEQLNAIPLTYLYQMLDQVVEITMKYESIDGEDETMDYSPGLFIVGENMIANKILAYLKKKYRQKHSQIEPLSVLRQYQYPNMDKLVESMKKVLGTDFIMKEDPLPLNYVVKEYLIS